MKLELSQDSINNIFEELSVLPNLIERTEYIEGKIIKFFTKDKLHQMDFKQVHKSLFGYDKKTTLEVMFILYSMLIDKNLNHKALIPFFDQLVKDENIFNLCKVFYDKHISQVYYNFVLIKSQESISELVDNFNFLNSDNAEIKILKIIERVVKNSINKKVLE